ncbi:unnamed protein product [Ilex paraguariensis]|uniref:F-box domain-containing protein n=1 Tax=Ilex paraguariensis TaxID=185542 RepID=A0ABC8RZ25_9AQUA
MKTLKKHSRVNIDHDHHGSCIRLPEDIMFHHILTRLPVKSLVGFRCVSKSWCSFLTSNNPSFIDLHLSRSQSCLATTTNLLMSGYDKQLQRECLLLTDLEGGGRATRLLMAADTIENERLLLSENINGLVCWHNTRCAYICNPSTRELVKLPIIPQTTRRIDSYNFGFDPSSKEFKVLNFRISWTGNGATCESFHIFTLGSDSWRRIHPALPFVFSDNLPWGLFSLINAVCLNGALHWIHEDMATILVFDLKDEKFRVIPLSSDVLLHASQNILLQVDGNLVVVCIRHGLNYYENMEMEMEIEILTLEDYQNEIWIKESIINPFRWDRDNFDDYVIPAVGKILLKRKTLFKNVSSGEVHLEDFCYDIKHKSLTSIRIPELSEGWLSPVHGFTNHIESIFSLSSQQTKALSKSGN